eukprot:COSAG06_NODE_8457_length_2168_cov_25.091832_1_plen_77_part_00
MLLGLHKTAEPLRVVAIFAGFKYGHVTVRYSPKQRAAMKKDKKKKQKKEKAVEPSRGLVKTLAEVDADARAALAGR